jgi:uncharacterized membrane protein
MNKLVLYHPRLWISLASGCAIFCLLPAHWSALSRVLVCWNCGVTLFLGLMFVWMTRLTAEQICTRYIEEDETAPIILIVVMIALPQHGITWPAQTIAATPSRRAFTASFED